MKIFNDDVSVTKPLIDRLKEVYPDRLPVDEISIEKLRFLQGQQSVITYLEALYEENLQEN
jgi:hypothetical protein